MRRRVVPAVLTLLAALTFVWPAVARALQPVSVEVTADRKDVTVGDRIALTVVFRLPATAQVDYTTIDQQLNDAAVDVLVIGLPEERLLAGGLKEIRIRYEVAFFRPGAAQIPALAIPTLGTDGTRGVVNSAPIAINVQSVLPPGADAAEVRDLKPQIELPFSAGVSRRAVMGAVAFVVVLSAIAALGFWWLWRRNMRAVPEPVAVAAASAPDAAARAELQRIAGLGLLDAGDYRTFHALIAACVRRFLSDHYGFPAFAMTTSELRSHMESEGVGRWQARLVAGLLSECDAVNYAQYTPARARAESNLSVAFEIVETPLDASSPAAVSS